MEDNTNNNKNDSVINGLKFGKKIYFEDSTSSSSTTNNSGNRRTTSSNVVVRSGGNNTSSSGGSSRRGIHGAGQQQNVPRCQVEGCQVDLSDVKAYYSRHKVCCMHSKSPKVVVSGMEQRFCQQCSRFHQLSEFDQGKRSCRRRLAGHNERRRKPQPGSMFSRFGRVPSTVFDNSGQTGGFLLDFTAPMRLGERDAWPPHARPFELVPGNESAGTGSSFSHLWQSNSHNSSSNLYLQGSSCGTGFSNARILPGECFTGVAVTDSTCALSLLSNQQPWGSRNSSLGASNMANAEATSMAHSTGPHGMALNQYPNPAWGFKAGDEAGNTSNELCPDLGLSQISQPLNTQFPSDPEMSQQSRRQYSEMVPSRAYDPSNQNMHWSL